MPGISFEKLTKWIDLQDQHIIDLQTCMTAIPALGPENGGTGEFDKAKLVKEYLDHYGYDECIEINAPDKRVTSGYRPNIIVKVKGRSSDRTVWIMSHMDVVPPGDLSFWKTDPYKVVYQDGKLYGRGTEDNQQGIVSSLLVLKSIREHKIIPDHDFGLVIVSDEETGSQYGIDYILEHRADLFQPEDWILIPDAGNETGTMIEIAEKSILWIKIEIIGKQTHGSTPEKGINTHRASAYLILKMEDLYQVYNQKNILFDPPGSTFEPTQREKNVESINTIPGKDTLFYDCRILPGIPLDTVIKSIKSYAEAIEKQMGVKILLSFPQKVEAPPPTPPDAPVAKAIQKAVQNVLRRTAATIGIGGGTVAAYFRNRSLPAVCWCTLDDTLHGPNEYARMENIKNDAKIFLHVVLENGSRSIS